MLGWLTGAQRADYADESGFDEPPQTPAPVFAARAFKSVFFNTPGDDDSPSKPAKITDKPEETKEFLSPARFRPTTSRSSELGSPAKRSPTKSILLTPGAATPGATARRKNVTFNDPVPRASQRSRYEPEKPSASLDPAGEHWQEEYNKYRVQTEKEMRKLVRYRQMAKSYARKMDQENISLKKQISEKDAEILELKRQLTACEIDGTSPLRHRFREPAEHPDPGLKGRQWSGNGPKEQRVDSRSSEGETKAVASQEGTRRMRAIERSRKTIKPVESGDVLEATKQALPRPADKVSSSRTISRKRRDGEDVGDAETAPSSEPEFSMLEKRPSLQQEPERDVLNERSSLINGSLVGGRGVSGKARLPPDRLAAAAARLKIKSEERRRAQGAGKENALRIAD